MSETTEILKSKTAEFKEKFGGAVKALGDVGATSKESYEAFSSSLGVTVKAFEGLGSETTSYSKKAVEDAVAATKAIFGAKSLKEIVAIQNDYTKSAFDGFLSFSNKVGELGVTSAQEAFEPITRQISGTIKKFATPAAA